MDKKITISIGPNIRLYREKAGASQAELAKYVGVKAGTVSNYELGITEPNITALVAIAKFLGVSVDTLLGIDDYMEELKERRRYRRELTQRKYEHFHKEASEGSGEKKENVSNDKAGDTLPPLPISVGRMLKHYRDRSHMSRGRLSEETGISQEKIESFEKGNNLPDLIELIKLGKVLNFSLDQLLDFDDIQDAPGEISVGPKIEQRMEEIEQRIETLIEQMQRLMVGSKHKRAQK